LFLGSLGKEAELDHPQLAKRLEMLEFLHRTLEEAQDHGEPSLVLEFCNPAPQEGLDSYNTLPPYKAAPRLTVFGMQVDVAKQLGISAVEAISLLRELETDECLHLDYSSSGPYVDAGEVTVGFTEKGWAAIGALPEPNQTLSEKLDVIAEGVRGLQGVSLDQKRTAIEAVGQLKRFVRDLPPERAVELLGQLPSVLGIGSK
jgi:hypothetical protein